MKQLKTSNFFDKNSQSMNRKQEKIVRPSLFTYITPEEKIQLKMKGMNKNFSGESKTFYWYMKSKRMSGE